MVLRYISIKGWPPALPSRQTNTIVVCVCLCLCSALCAAAECMSLFVCYFVVVCKCVCIVYTLCTMYISLTKRENDSNRLPMNNVHTPTCTIRNATLFIRFSYTLLPAIVFNLSVMNNIMLLIYIVQRTLHPPHHFYYRSLLLSGHLFAAAAANNHFK